MAAPVMPALRPVLRDRAQCPCPWKVCYADEATAWRQTKHTRATGKQNKKLSKKLLPYHCRCGAWHIGHDRRWRERRAEN